jgi:anti-sigma factor RsiW
MKEPSMHCGDEQLQMLLDGRLPGREKEETLRHLQVCSRCAAVFKGMERMDRGLRQMPVSSVSREFTSKVMDEIAPSTHLSLAFRIVENMAYLFAALVVLGMIAVVFVATGVIDSGQVSEGQDLVGAYTGAVSDWLVSAIRGATMWLAPYLPAKGGTSVMLFGIGVLGGLALLDRVLNHKFADRIR